MKLFLSGILALLPLFANAFDGFRLGMPKTITVKAGDRTLDYLSFSEIPQNYSEWSNFAGGLGIEYSVEEKKLGSIGSSACAHSPACVIVIPFMLADAVKLWASKEYRNEIIFFIDDARFILNYHKSSGAFIYGEIGQNEERIHSAFIESLNQGYIYFDGDYDKVKNHIIEMAAPKLEKATKEDRAEILGELREGFYAVTHELFERNLFRGDLRAELISQHCGSLVGNDSSILTLDRVVATRDPQAEAALIQCATERGRYPGELSNYESFRPFWSAHWPAFCESKPDLNDITLSKSLAFYQGAKSLKISLPECSIKELSTQHKFLDKLELSTEEWISLNQVHSFSKFVDHYQTDEQRFSPTHLAAKLHLANKLRIELPARELDALVMQKESSTVEQLFDYYFKDFSEPIKVVLISATDHDARRQATLLEYLSKAPDLTKSLWRSKLEALDKAEWSRLHLALAYVVGVNVKPSEFAALFENDEGFEVPTSPIDVDVKLNKKGVSLTLVHFAMHLAKIHESEIEKVWRQYHQANSLLDRSKKLLRDL